MSQTKKGRQWYFGMKAHIGLDAESGYGAQGRVSVSHSQAAAGLHDGVLPGTGEESPLDHYPVCACHLYQARRALLAAGQVCMP